MPAQVHVAVDAHNLARDDRGIGRYAREILKRGLHAPGFRWTFVVRDFFARAHPIASALGEASVTVTNRIPRGASVLWHPWNGTFLNSSLPSVATMHDATPFLFPSPDARIRRTEQTPFLKTAASARRIIVQSQYTASEIQRWLGVAAERIVVISLAAGPAFATSETALQSAPSERYILCVGAHDVRKNTATLVAAFERVFPDGDTKLVFTRTPPCLPKGGAVVAARDDAELAALYRGALLVTCPSPYEGFGLPLLEALACGAPVLAARGGALPEVGAGAAAWVDQPLDVDCWEAALRALDADGAWRARLARLGPARAAAFSWDRCTSETLAVLRAVAQDGQGGASSAGPTGTPAHSFVPAAAVPNPSEAKNARAFVS